MASRPQVSVIVPARDAAATLARTLAALAEQRLEGSFEVLVVDDGSSDQTAEIAAAASGPVTLLRQAPLGPAAARNAGVERARGAALAFCDADVFPAPGWLAAGLAALGRADLVQGRVLPDPQAPLGPFDRTLWITSQVGLWETANLFVTRELFERVGGFQEWIRPRRGKALAEDVWFGYRALRAGARPAFCAEALAHHAVFARDWAAYVAERTRLYHFPAMARRMPELREAFLHRRVFLNWRTARFDLALGGATLGVLLGSPLALAAAAPYLHVLHAHAHRSGARGSAAAAIAAADLAADAASFLALAAGGLRYGALVI
jgi:glycosyltransferase involved in cell wall biosynthesis